MRRVLAILLTLAVFPAAAAAQMCMGNAPIGDQSRAAVHGGAGFYDGATNYATGFTMGSDYLFSAGFGYMSFDDVDVSQKSLSVGGAYQMDLGESGAVLCPGVTVGYGFGLELLGVDLTSWSVTPAASVGYPMAVSPTFAVVPFSQLGIVWQHFSIDGGSLGSESGSDTSGLLGLGVSFLFNDQFSFAPTLSIPLGAEGSDEVFGFMASVGIPRR